ncbi:Hypothetical protein CINCED_3A024923 [Cinara cedri]|uniref:Mariner Mos1 transposase n=1 Tax=Cinara cedri TaxID=506608 RepID=A0A5E4NF52_9HEMI|nr:Hypothetical protein CINCED_3A024923 [Cinara cedri]
MGSRGSNCEPTLLFDSFGNIVRMSSHSSTRTRVLLVLEHASYSLDLAPCDFYLFPKIKSAFKGIRFEPMEEVKQKSAELLNGLTKTDFQHCLEQWKKRMKRCVKREGEYIEGEHSVVE